MDNISDRVSRIETENGQLRMKSDADARTIDELRSQYDELHAHYQNAMTEWARERLALVSERDRANTAATEIEGLLNTSAGMVMEALRKRRGDATPARPSDAIGKNVDHPKLPRLGIDGDRLSGAGVKVVLASGLDGHRDAG